MERLIDEITVAVREQEQGVDQIRHAVMDIDAATQKTAENAEKVRLCSEDVENEADGMLVTTDALQAVVYGTGCERAVREHGIRDVQATVVSAHNRAV